VSDTKRLAVLKRCTLNRAREAVFKRLEERLELEIGISGEAVTEMVLNFIETSSAKRPEKP
jgi:hypothetical protein